VAQSRHPVLRGRVGRGLAVASVVGGLALVGSSQLRMQYLVDRLDEEAGLRVATQCVAAHERTDQIRDGDERTYRRLADTLIELASDADPAIVDRYRVLIERDVAEVRAANKRPDCDLRAAQAKLDGTNGGNE